VAEDERRAALDRAVRALARRDHSAAGLGAKLERAGVSADAQADALGALRDAGYLDDERFARGRAEHLAARGYGDEWIRADLAAQGVAAETVEAALEALEPEAERARRAWRSLDGGTRAARTLARRGFGEETLEPLVAQDPDAGVG
jgi:regulatory protein